VQLAAAPLATASGAAGDTFGPLDATAERRQARTSDALFGLGLSRDLPTGRLLDVGSRTAEGVRRQLGILSQAQSGLEATAEEHMSLNMANLEGLHRQMALLRAELEAARAVKVAATRPLTEAEAGEIRGLESEIALARRRHDSLRSVARRADASKHEMRAHLHALRAELSEAAGVEVAEAAEAAVVVAGVAAAVGAGVGAEAVAGTEAAGGVGGAGGAGMVSEAAEAGGGEAGAGAGAAGQPSTAEVEAAARQAAESTESKVAAAGKLLEDERRQGRQLQAALDKLRAEHKGFDARFDAAQAAVRRLGLGVGSGLGFGFGFGFGLGLGFGFGLGLGLGLG
jgi:hypothetical protein